MTNTKPVGYLALSYTAIQITSQRLKTRKLGTLRIKQFRPMSNYCPCPMDIVQCPCWPIFILSATLSTTIAQRNTYKSGHNGQSPGFRTDPRNRQGPIIKFTFIRLFQTCFHSGFCWFLMVQRLVFLSIEKLHYLLHLASISDCHVGQLDARHLVKENQNAIQKLKIATHPLFLILGISSPKLQPPTNNLPSSFSSIGIYITCTLKGYSSNECHFKSIN